ncbi:MAG: ABC transporter substrate-binding protein [Ignavibacteria bacterium]|nr:ABC transporter substrate-binding protein [Ignavibacteria bacterium]MBI3764992.1 ABC transporter substrate-binding protein [Ignavibacteriales bacterium]
MVVRKFALLLSLELLLIIGAAGQEKFQYSVDAERQFISALQLFQSGKFGEALGTFDSLRQQQPTHQRTTAAYVMAAKALFHLTKYPESITLLVNMLKLFPETNYIDDARYTLGLDYMMLHWYEAAATQFLRCMEATDDPKVSRSAAELFESIADKHMKIESLRRLSAQLARVETKDLVMLKMAEKMSAAGDVQGTSEIVENILNRQQPSSLVNRVRSLKDINLMRSRLKIGIMLPLMKKDPQSPWKPLADDMMDGIQFALSQYQEHHRTHVNVSLEIRDTGRDSANALGVIREFCEDRDVIGVIGPLFSNIAMICAPAAETCRIPLISPTATANGIAAVGSHIFQGNPDLASRGKSMARYAVEQLGLTSLAILGPADLTGKAVAESFSSEAKRLGASIVMYESYEKGASDLSEQFLAIRKAGLPPDSQAGSQEDLSISVTSIQGIFIPISDAEEIDIIAPQLTYFNIKAQLLGTGEWYSPDQLDAQKRYLNGAIFISDFYMDRHDPAYSEFAGLFYREKKKHPSKYTLFGYDTMQLIFQQIDAGATTREKLTEALSRVKSFPGIHSKISLINGRVNSELIILKYLNGDIKKLTEVSLN